MILEKKLEPVADEVGDRLSGVVLELSAPSDAFLTLQTRGFLLQSRFQYNDLGIGSTWIVGYILVLLYVKHVQLTSRAQKLEKVR